jgi:hypothetical protein
MMSGRSAPASSEATCPTSWGSGSGRRIRQVLSAKKAGREVEGVGLDVLGQGQDDGPRTGRVGEDAHGPR